MATIIDIARRAGVSKTLVSRALNGQPGVGVEARRRIEEAARALAYRPNLLARSLAIKTTRTIGVVLDSLCEPYYFELIRGMEEGARAAGYRLLFCSAHNDGRSKASYVDFFTQGYVDGVVIYGSDLNDLCLLEALRVGGFPFVVVEQELDGTQVNNVVLDNAGGARMATERLLRAGCRDVRHFTGDMGKAVSADRLRGYMAAMREHDLPGTIVQADFTRASGAQAMADLLAARDVPDGIFFAADATAYGAMEVLLAHGLRIPQDIRLVGFDDDAPAGQDLRAPGLTTVRQPLRAMGACALQVLVRAIQDAAHAPEQVRFQPELLARETC